MKQILILVGCLILAILVLPAVVHPPPTPNASPRVAAVAESLISSVENYVSEYGERPPGDQAELIRVLRGENPKEITFFECSPQALNSKGELLDPWGTPFRVTFDADSQVPRMHSAGPDRVFDPEATAMFGDDFHSGKPAQ